MSLKFSLIIIITNCHEKLSSKIVIKKWCETAIFPALQKLTHMYCMMLCLYVIAHIYHQNISKGVRRCLSVSLVSSTFLQEMERRPCWGPTCSRIYQYCKCHIMEHNTQNYIEQYNTVLYYTKKPSFTTRDWQLCVRT